MKKNLVLYFFLSFVLVGVFTLSAYSEVQTTFTKTNNVITVKAKPDAAYSGQFTAFAFTLRYPTAEGISFSTPSSIYLPGAIVGITQLDPTDGAYTITSFFINNGTSTVSWAAGTEYDIFSVSVNGGLGTVPFSIVIDEPQYIYGYCYYELDFMNDITNYVNPIYAGSDNLVITTATIGPNFWTYGTQDLYLGKYWLTTGTSDWSTSSNWSGAAVPLAGEDAAIIAGGTQPIAGAGAVANRLKVETGATVNVAFNGSLTVNGNLEVADDNGLVVNSTAAGTGSLITNGLVPAGNKVKVQRYISAANWSNGTDGWHLLSSPVTGQSITGGFTPTGAGNDYDFYAWSETGQEWLNQDVPSNGITSFIPGKGYLVAYEQAGTKEFSGPVNSADQSFTLSNSGPGVSMHYGYNLLGNPFPSALTWGTGWTLTNIGPFGTYVWSDAAKDYSLINPGDPIPAMNGFMVYTSAASQALTIPAAARTHNSTSWYKSTEQQVKLIAHDPEGASYKASMLRFNPEATAGFDLAYDAYMLSGFAPKFYSTADSKSFGLNTLPEITFGLTVPFGFVKNASSNFTIELAESIDGHILYLRDKKTNTVVNLSTNPNYSFTSTEGDNADRFELVFDLNVGVKELPLASANVYSLDKRIVIDNVYGATTMDVINVQGQVLKNFKFNSTGTHEISVNLLTGVYMVRLHNGGEMKTMKVFVK